MESLYCLMGQCSVVKHLLSVYFRSNICSIVNNLQLKGLSNFWKALWLALHLIEFIMISLYFWVTWECKNKILFQNWQFHLNAFDMIWKYSLSKWDILHNIEKDVIYFDITLLFVCTFILHRLLL